MEMLPRNKSGKFACPCCGCFTLDEGEIGSFEICPVCFWEVDNVQFADPEYAGGANTMSLVEARMKFAEIGAIDEEFRSSVRPPHDYELPPFDWSGQATTGR
jgi:hypothetical protein